MENVIEVAKSGRAACRTCKEKIAKDELRLGEAVPNAFSDGDEPSYRWHHLKCAATKKPSVLRSALATYAGDVPDKAELETLMAASKGKEKPSTFPYAERAPTGRSTCQGCEEPIAKGELRVAIEREVDAGSFARKSAGYLHPACAPAEVEHDDLLGALKKNSVSLAAADLTALEAELKKGASDDEDAEDGEDVESSGEEDEDGDEDDGGDDEEG
jgi:hypothetical protein